MFSILRAPTPVQMKRRAGIALSASVHCLVIGALVHASGIAGPAVSTRPIEAALVFVPLPTPRHTRPTGPDAHAPAAPHVPSFDVEPPTVVTNPVASIDAAAPVPPSLPTPGGLFPLGGESHDAGHDSASPPGPVGGPLDATEVDKSRRPFEQVFAFRIER